MSARDKLADWAVLAMVCIALVLIAMGLGGCNIPPESRPDQCLRKKLFEACMRSLPPGPPSPHYNDWDDVINACSKYAAYASTRRPEAIKPECRT